MNLKYPSVQDYDKCLKERTELGGGGGGGARALATSQQRKQFLSDLLGV